MGQHATEYSIPMAGVHPTPPSPAPPELEPAPEPLDPPGAPWPLDDPPGLPDPPDEPPGLPEDAPVEELLPEGPLPEEPPVAVPPDDPELPPKPGPGCDEELHAATNDAANTAVSHHRRTIAGSPFAFQVSTPTPPAVRALRSNPS
jgi:hypothetical protein